MATIAVGETFSIADKNEAWVMEMIGKGPGNKGAVWVAIRISDDCISAHANQSRIQQIPFDDKENCIYSPDVVSFAPVKRDISVAGIRILVSRKPIARMISVLCVVVKPVCGLSFANMINRWINIWI